MLNCLAAYGRRRTGAIFGDSRANEELYKEIQKCNLKHLPFSVEQYKGAKLEEVIIKADVYLDSYPFDVAYITAGVNNITDTNKETGKASFSWRSEQELTDHLIDIMTKGYSNLKSDHPEAVIIFCPLVGLDLFRVTKGGTKKQQEMVDNAVWSLKH